MGLNILVYGPALESSQEWDSTRLSGDREFAKLFGELPCDRIGAPPDYEPEYRITDFAAWRTAIAAQVWPNPGRYEKLMDILEANPSFYVYLSY